MVSFKAQMAVGRRGEDTLVFGGILARRGTRPIRGCAYGSRTLPEPDRGEVMNSIAPGARPQPRPGILDIAPYVPGKSGANGAKVHKLSSNESALGASPNAKAAFAALADSLELYPDGSASMLREALGRRYGLNPHHIVCGAGSDELLQLIAHAFLGPGDEAIHSQ